MRQDGEGASLLGQQVLADMVDTTNRKNTGLRPLHVKQQQCKRRRSGYPPRSDAMERSSKFAEVEVPLKLLLSLLLLDYCYYCYYCYYYYYDCAYNYLIITIINITTIIIMIIIIIVVIIITVRLLVLALQDHAGHHRRDGIRDVDSTKGKSGFGSRLGFRV